MDTIVLKGRPIVGGVVEGEALVSQDPLVWSHGVYPPTGKINDVRVKLNGTSVKDKILVYPYGKGSTSTSTWMLETFRYGNGPKAILNKETEGLIAIGSILADVLYKITAPIVDRFDQDPLLVIETGDWVKVDGNKGIVEVTKKKQG
ncbi:MAG: aconitase/3-isopropylmalate dehydratase, swivel [Firmicutes bacterium]|nr:aconitase/3-isopropylmalate dehydratase, swivel [Bacillota bacterium]